MWKWVIQDYFEAFRWEKIKIWLKNGSWWTVFYCGFIMPSILFHSLKLSLALLSVPILFAMFTQSVHVEALPKVMFISPLSREKRKDYIAKTYLFRMMITMVVGVIFAWICLVRGICRPGTAILYIWNIWILSLTSSGLCQEKVFLPSEKKQAGSNQTISGIAAIMMILSIICIYVLLAIGLYWSGKVMFWTEIVFIGIAVLIQLPLTIQILRKWEENVRKASSFERLGV